MDWYYLDEDQTQQPFAETSLTSLVGSGTIRSETLVWNETLPNWTPAAKAFPDRFPEGSAESLPEIADPVPSVAPTTTSAVTPSTAGAPMIKKPAQSPSIGIVKVSRLPSGDNPSLSTSPQIVRAAVEASSSLESIKNLASYLAASAGWIKLLGILSIISGVAACLTVVGIVIGWLPIWMGVILSKTAKAAKWAETTGDETALAEALDRLRLYFKLLGILMLIQVIFVAIYLVVILVFGLAVGLGGLEGLEGLESAPQ